MDELRILTKKNNNENTKQTLINYNKNNTISNENIYNPIKYTISNYKTVKAHDSDILCSIYSNGYLITGSSDKTIKIWDIENSKLVKVLTNHTSGIYALTIWNNYLISGSSDKTIRIWDLENFNLLTTILAHQNQIYSLSCHDNFLISSSLDKTIKIWNIEAKKLIGVINLELSAWCIIIHDNKIFAGLSDGTLRVYNLANGKLISSCKEHSEAITQIKIYNNKVYTCSKDQTIKIWNIDNIDLENSIDTIKQVIWSILPDNNYIFVGGDDKTLKVWDLHNKKIIQNINAHNDWVSQIILSQQKIITVSGDGIIKIWKKQPFYNCENIVLDIKSIDKSPFETDNEFNDRKMKSYIDLANKIIDYDYISIGAVKLLVDEYNFETNILPLNINVSCEKIIKLSKLEKEFKSYIVISKEEAKILHENNVLNNLYIKYYSEKNNLRYELSVISLDKKYLISPNFTKIEPTITKKKEIKKDRLDIKIKKPDVFNDKSLYNHEHDCNTIVLSDTFKKPFEDYNDFEKRVKEKLINYRYIHCGKIELLADKYSIEEQKFPIKTIFTCDKLLNIISLLPEENKLVSENNTSKQLVSLKKYEFFSCIMIDRHNAKELYENSKSQNLYINFVENLDKLCFELFIIFDEKRYFIM